MRFMLTSDDYEKAWNGAKERIDSFIEAASNKPIFLSLGAQPGSGKTKATRAVMDTIYPKTAFALIDGDRLREFHKYYDDLVLNSDPDVMPRETAALSGYLVGRSLDYQRENKMNTHLEGTFRNSELVCQTLKTFYESGFKTHVVVLGVPATLSWQGCIDRYITAFTHGSNPRWAPFEAHNAGYDGTTSTLKVLHDYSYLSRLTIMDRAGHTAYDNERTKSGTWTDDSKNPSYILDRLRADTTNLETFYKRQDQLKKLAKEYNLPDQVAQGLAQADKLAEEWQRLALHYQGLQPLDLQTDVTLKNNLRRSSRGLNSSGREL